MLLHRRPLASCLAAAFCLASPLALATNRTVINCNDSGTGSLRAAITAAVSGDTVVFDTVSMACTMISVTSGQLEVGVHTLTLQGPASPTLTISAGAGASRVIRTDVSVGGFSDTSSKLAINNLVIADGHFTATLDVGGEFQSGGCIQADGDVTLSNSTVTGCSVTINSGNAVGGGIASYSLHAYNSRIINNVASATAPPNSSNTYGALGGGAWVRGGSLVVKSTTISNNTVEASGSHTVTYGGGLSITQSDKTKTISASTISGNSADRGGGLYAYFAPLGSTSQYEPLIIDGTTISGNHANHYGGGVDVNAFSGQVEISNSTISGNDSSGLMAGFSDGAGSSTFTGDTIVFNTSAKGSITSNGHVYMAASGLDAFDGATLRNTIVANNVATDTGASDFNTDGSTVDGSHNLIMATLAGTTAPADTLTADPMLDALADNGGPTQTHALLAGSPVIDAGCAAAGFPNDQRGPGYPRIWGAAPDIGAYEAGDPASGDSIFRGGFDALGCAP